MNKVEPRTAFERYGASRWSLIIKGRIQPRKDTEGHGEKQTRMAKIREDKEKKMKGTAFASYGASRWSLII